ncbi:MAG TPA: hypothetical protein VFE47_25390, partial [Tepidisphaeraceae bacterium]|nr:hypothetical protein [Tepidisphaeraceae bacterium]
PHDVVRFCRVGVLAYSPTSGRISEKKTVGEYAHPTEKTGHFHAAGVSGWRPRSRAVNVKSATAQ